MENKYVCSVDIGGTKIATAIMEYPADGSVPHPVFEAEVPTEAQEGGEAVFQRIEASIKAALEANPDVEVLGVGIGAAGVVDPKTGAIAYANEIMPGWSGVQLGPRLREDLGLPVAVVGDVQAHALGEAHWGVGKGKFSVLCLGIGTGIGGGLVIDGKMVHGLVHPEMGHMLLAPQEGDSMPDGVCPYHRHCLEGLASGPAIEKRWGLSAKLMTEDHPAWELEATYLAQMCVNMIVTVSPEVIVLGGGVMQQMHLFPQIRERVLKLLGGYVSSPSITPEGIDSYIVPPALGVNSGVIGALLLGAQALEKEGEV